MEEVNDNVNPTSDGAPSATDAVPEEGPREARVDFFTMLGTVPAVIRNYLVSPIIAERREAVAGQFKLNDAEKNIVLYTELETFFRDCPLDEFPDRLFTRLPWEESDEERARQLAIEVLGRIMLPAQAYLGDVPGLIDELGGDLKSFPQDLLELRTTTYREGAAEIAEASAPEDASADMRKRLAHIVESRLRQVRDDMDTLEMLTKSKKTGGMELNEGQAKDVLDTIASKTRMTKYVEAIEEEKPVAPSSATPSVAPAEPAREYTAVEIKKLYSGTQQEQEGIAKRVKRFREVTESDSVKMRDAYYQVIYPPDLRPTDPAYVVAGLIAFAEDREVADLLADDDRYKDIIRKYYTETAKGGDAAGELARFESDSKDPVFVNLFLQLLLRGFAGYEDAESARFGLRIINTLKKVGDTQYAGLVVFDMERGAFKWMTPIELS